MKLVDMLTFARGILENIHSFHKNVIPWKLILVLSKTLGVLGIILGQVLSMNNFRMRQCSLPLSRGCQGDEDRQTDRCLFTKYPSFPHKYIMYNIIHPLSLSLSHDLHMQCDVLYRDRHDNESTSPC